MNAVLVAKFHSSFDAKTDGCQIWQRGLNSEGYGRLCFGGKTYYAHRLAWELTFGAIPGGLFVCHRCDTPACVNPAHLFLGTNQENIADMNVKGRARGGALSGQRNPQSKLTATDVLAIRASKEPRALLAQRYGVTLRHIYGIRSRSSWLDLAALEAA